MKTKEPLSWTVRRSGGEIPRSGTGSSGSRTEVAPIMATCKTQSAVGTTVCRLGAEGEFLDYTLGIMDGRDHKNKSGDWVGKWLVLPWVTKASRATMAGKPAMVYQQPAKGKAA